MTDKCGFEYSRIDLAGTSYNRDSFETYLKELWRNRSFMYADEYEVIDEVEVRRKSSYQPFFRFDNQALEARNFVGFVQSEETVVEIFPKVFKRQYGVSKDVMMRHLFHWFSYCRKVRFPFSPTTLDKLDIDTIPELIIYLFADTCNNVLSSQPYRRYQEVEEVLLMPRGRIDFTNYMRHGLVSGNHHQIDCDNEPFIYDNLLNRGIKYVCRLLRSVAKFDDTKQLLDNVFFILDEVEDIWCTSSELERIHLNPLFSDYVEILDWCKRFLDQQLYSHNSYDVKQWALLLPMEYVFEDFIAGFIEQKFTPKYTVKYQKSDLYLSTNPQAFNLQQDIVISDEKRSIILDTKYKVRSTASNSEVKKGVDQSDMYQMVSYAIRRKCTDVILCYPGTTTSTNPDFTFTVRSEFDKTEIRITGVELPFTDSADPKSLDDVLFRKLETVLQNVFNPL